MSVSRSLPLIIVALLVGGCGQESGSGGAVVASSSPTPVVAQKVATPLSISATNMVLTGSVSADSPTAYVLVNNERATITGSTWSYTLRSVDARNQTVRVQLYVNGLLADATEINVSTSK